MNFHFLSKIDRWHLAGALLVLLGSLVVYIKTMAPTVSFWDCGEFIAVSAILGIPHPPGAPLYVMIGRIFSIIPIFEDISARVNLLSAVSSAFAALFCYLCGVRILKHWFKNNLTSFNKLLLYGGSVSGAFMAAFGLTNWNNSVEAEVYGLAMVFMTAMLWLTLIYLDTDDEQRANRILLLVTYLAFLGIAVHMTTFLAVPIIAIAYVLKKKSPSYIWFILAGFIFFELYLIFALSSQPEEVPFYVPILMVAIVYMFFIFSFEQIRALYLIVAGGFALSVLPLYAQIYQAAVSAGAQSSTASASTMSLLGNIGGLTFIGMVIFALFALTKFLKNRKNAEPVNHYLHVSVFILSAAVMTAILLIDSIKGYTSFKYFAVISTAILALLIYRFINWSILIAFGGLLLIMVGVMPFVYGVGISAAVLIVGGLFKLLPNWKTAVLMILVAVIGFSSHLFIPIRSAHQPSINENNPSKSIQASINYLERKQYGSQSMVERMFKRRAEWMNQFGNFQRMGYWLAFSGQFGIQGSAFVFPFLIGVFGLWEILRRGPRKGVLLFLLVLLSSAGLVLYMNFADGTRINPVTGQDYLEVRERDYFFTPAFILFGLCIGLGAGAIVEYVRESLRNMSSSIRVPVVSIASALLFLPLIALAKNYHYADRTGNYVPFDYGWNLLQSADPNAIFFTNGDNDTFPLWCLQEAYGIRTDVKVVNLSLSNTDWYIKQLAPNLGLKFSMTDAEIEALRSYRTSDGQITRTHHQVMDRLIDENKNERPINYSVTVGGDNRRYRGQSADSLIALMGYNWRLYDKPMHFGVDVEAGYDFFTNPDKFRCRGAADPDVYLDDTSERLTHNLANGFMVLADTLRKAKDYERAEEIIMRCRTLMPRATEPLQLLARIFSEQGKIEQLRTMIDTSNFERKEVLLFFLGHAFRLQGDDSQSEAAFNSALQINPTYRPAFDDLMRVYIERRQFASVRAGLMRWLQFNPQDEQIRQLYKEMEKIITGDTLGGTRK